MLFLGVESWIGPLERRMKSKLYPIGVALVLLMSIMMAGILMVPK